MILLADAGATKINWAINTENATFFTTSGFNPNISDSNYLRQLLISGFPSNILPAKVSEIHYFGTGCGSESGKQRVSKALKAFFTECEKIAVMTDLEGASKGVLGSNKGVVGILGTGANAGYYNGESIIKTPPSLGYLLGDEGSGAYLGKEFAKYLLRNKFAPEVADKFYADFGFSSNNLVKHIYSSPKPNQLFGSFVPFMKENINEPEIGNIVHSAFKLYYTNYLKDLFNEFKASKVIMIGGVAEAFKNQLTKVLGDNKINLEVVETPLKAMLNRYNF